MKNKDKPCEKCGHNRWKTKQKGEQYQCRKCDNIRKVNS
jgi:tRNA(Ile2) C34 agmatinyltransferase TiaS